jgi:DNA mismatch endonuclease (patch repair protein)
MQRQKRRDTPCELALRAQLDAMRFVYETDVAPLESLRRRADVLFRRERIAVFVDGCFWHRCPDHGTSPKANGRWWKRKLDRNVARDRDTDAVLARAGWIVLRFWEHDEAELAALRVRAAIRRRRARPKGRAKPAKARQRGV